MLLLNYLQKLSVDRQSLVFKTINYGHFYQSYTELGCKDAVNRGKHIDKLLVHLLLIRVFLQSQIIWVFILILAKKVFEDQLFRSILTHSWQSSDTGECKRDLVIQQFFFGVIQQFGFKQVREENRILLKK